MHKLIPILLLILLGLVVGYLLGGYVLVQQNFDQIWMHYLDDNWSEICSEDVGACTSVSLDLSDAANFQLANIPERYSLGETLTGRWNLLIADENGAMFSLTGLSNESIPQAYVIYLKASQRDQNTLELMWIDAGAGSTANPNELLDDTFIFERVK